MSSQDNNDNMFEEEVEGEEEEPRQTTATSGSKRQKSGTTAKSTSDSPLVKVRKQMAPRSDVWAHFIKQIVDPKLANCRYCGAEIGCDTKTNGTSTMRGHITRCKLFKAHEEAGSQKVLSSDPSGVMTTTMKYDKELFRRSVNEMIVLNELPFSFVESEGFRRFCFNLLPCYHVHCRRTATKDIFAMFLQEKVALKKLFTSEKKRISLTTDIRVAPTTSCSYMVVTAHWIDANWVMQKRIINFKPVIDHKGETIASHLVQCLEEWGIEKVFTVTVDNAKENDKALRLFMDALRLKEAHVRQSIVAIRNAVKYVRSSSTRYKSFELRVETGNVSRGSLCLDVVTRWNSTYLMLSAALKLRVAFQKMLEEDMPYNEYFLEHETDEDGVVRELPPQKRIGPPSNADWEEVGKMVKFLKIFFNCTLAFSASKSVTSSMCYNEIFIVEKNLIALSTHNDERVRNQAGSMRAKFDKYWDGILNMNPLVIIASVMDPRNKMQFATICIDKLYGKNTIGQVRPLDQEVDIQSLTSQVLSLIYLMMMSMIGLMKFTWRWTMKLEMKNYVVSLTSTCWRKL
ncbi:PREDICTED: zinc finger BED domain-containing protein RICESLEEPER 2-like [Camelina sativa]|uniref:Zinc finger BED domain-containing protein RICESLEEPER 2-like n=1 Tax=Camelina sativa TaxID=90675 RepID=A0ABM1RL83_CAMSA|nr:PREDICTED: zinc finger BED domain-containing protein RICESLEEPER 2-like [Camelina sativa]